MTKKLLAKCDSSFPGERVNALDLLYDHLQKIGQKFSDLVHEFEQAIPAQKYADLEQLYNHGGEGQCGLGAALQRTGKAAQRGVAATGDL